MELDTVARVRSALYRLVGTVAADTALVAQGESAGDVANYYITRGCRRAQRWMIDVGYAGWRKRSSALSFSGSDDADGGRYWALPTDFMRAWGRKRESALRKANGDGWGVEITPEEAHLKGAAYYLKNTTRGDELWLARGAQPPTVYLEYHYQHPVWSSLADANIDFPTDARPLIVAEAANIAKEDNWLPGGPELEVKIDRAVRIAREEARLVARQTKQPRRFRQSARYGNHWSLLPFLPLFLGMGGPQ